MNLAMAGIRFMEKLETRRLPMTVYKAKDWAPSSKEIAQRDGQVQPDRWCAQISIKGTTKYIGSFPTRSAAREAWRAATLQQLKPSEPIKLKKIRKLIPYAGKESRKYFYSPE